MWNLDLCKILFTMTIVVSCAAAQEKIPNPSKSKNTEVEMVNDTILKCAHVDQIVVENSKNRPICFNPKEENACLYKGVSFLKAFQNLNRKLFESCLIFGKKIETNAALKSIPIRIEMNVEEVEQLKFANWADKNIDLLIKLEGFHTSSHFGEIIIVGHQPSPFLMQGVLDPQLMNNDFESNRTWPYAPQFLNSVDELIHYLKDQPIQTHFEGLDSIAEQVVQLSENPPQTKIVETYRESGCQTTCIKESSRIDLSKGQAFYREFISNQNVYRSEWIIENEYNQVVGLLYMAKKFPALSVKISRNSNGFAESVEVKNRQGDLIFQEKWNSTELVGSQKSNGVVDFDSIDIAKVGVCEDSLNPKNFFAKHNGNFILKGPRSSESFYGWMGQEFNLSGRLHINKIGLPIDQFFLDEHSLEVAGELSQGEPIGLIPLGIDACLNPKIANEWWPTFKQSGARVINMSLRNPDDPFTCSQWVEKHPINNDREAVLWVVAAGNQGVEGANGCPQFFSGQANIIVVGASDGQYVHRKSNYGIDLVDLYVDGQTFDGHSWGTSFSAPKVAKTAAQIFERFPNLSVEQVKASIMLSVYWPSRWLDSRSGGILDSTSAIELAEFIDINKGNLEKALEDKYKGYFFNKEYKKRNELLEKLFKGDVNE
jgi:hypothetical protein